jgi:hypothetical protein
MVPGRYAKNSTRWTLAVTLGRVASLGAACFLAGCDDLPASFRAPPPPPPPLTLPAADGRAAQIIIGDGFRYVVNRQALEQAKGGVMIRITRASAPELTYSDGLTAKTVAEAYCAGFNRALNPSAFGRFSNPASWVFEWGCL